MVRPKKESKVKFLMQGDDEVKEGKVVNVGKKTSLKRNTVWLCDENDVTIEVDFNSNSSTKRI